MKNEKLVWGFEVGLRGAKAAFRKFEKAFLNEKLKMKNDAGITRTKRLNN